MAAPPPDCHVTPGELVPGQKVVLSTDVLMASDTASRPEELLYTPTPCHGLVHPVPLRSFSSCRWRRSMSATATTTVATATATPSGPTQLGVAYHEGGGEQVGGASRRKRCHRSRK